MQNCEFCRVKTEYIATKNGYRHFRCEGCGHVFVFPMPSFMELDAYYNQEYEYIKPPNLNIDKRHRFIANFFKENQQETKILDIGCANGDFLAGLMLLGMKSAHGIELNKEMAEVAKKRGISIEVGMFNSNSFKGQKFQCINLGDVLEHVPDPRLVLTDIKNLLDKEGILIISTPNIGNFFSNTTFRLSKLFGFPWSSLDPPAHINLFTNQSLSFLLTELSMERISSWAYRAPLFYELGHTHLYRKYREERNVRNMANWLLGWSLYIVLFMLNIFISRITRKDTGMLYVVRHM